MKKNLLFSGLLAGTFAITLGFTSCEKEAIYAPNTVVRDQDPKEVPTADGILTVSGSCGYIVSCGSIGAYGPKYNQITFAKDASTILNYPNLRYSIYKYTSGPVSGISTYTKIDEFVCNSNTVTYATSLLDNSTSHYLILTDPSTTTPATATLSSSGFSIGTAFAFTTGNLKGGSCNPK